MAGAFLDIEVSGLAEAQARLAAFASRTAAGELLPLVGALVESQTRDRFQTRQAPDGSPWPEWSPAYAAGRHHGQSLLVAEGHLRDSIGWTVDGDAAQVGSNLAYAAIQNFGGRAGRGLAAQIPQRQYLGLSEPNEVEIGGEIGAWIAGVLGA